MYPPQNPGGGAAVASLVLGILSIIMPCVGSVLAIIGLVLAIVAKNKRTLSRGLSTAGMVLSIIGLLLQALWISAWFPAIGTARQMAKMAACQANMSNIGKAVLLYKSDNGDQYPSNLQILVKGGNITGKSLRCPEDQIASGSSYFYCPPEDGGKQGNAIIACDATTRHSSPDGTLWFNLTKDTVSVLRADGSVALLNNNAFQQELKKPYNARFAAEYAKAVSMSPQQRLTYSPTTEKNGPAESEPDDPPGDESE